MCDGGGYDGFGRCDGHGGGCGDEDNGNTSVLL